MPTSNPFLRVFDKTFDRGPIGLNIIPHRLLFSSNTGKSYAIACAIIKGSTDTFDVQANDIVLSVGNLSVINAGHSFIIDSNLSTQFCEQVQSVIADATFPKTLKFMRLLQTPVGAEDESSTQVTFEVANNILDGKLPLSGIQTIINFISV
jgi:hypothetical protein